MVSDAAVEELEQRWYDQKSAWMEASLGQAHDIVMHAIVPYSIGGGLDLYYYPNRLPGTAIATMELSEVFDEGPSNEVYRNYELVMFTRHSLDLDAANDDATAFGRMHRTISAILNQIAPFSEQAKLNPNDTCEFPTDIERIGRKCLIFDGYSLHSNEEYGKFGLLAIIEIFPSEMAYARENGGANLLDRLKVKGHYPYSDLDREPVS